MIGQQWTVTPLLLGGSNIYFFTNLYCTRIGLNALFALRTKEGGKERAFRNEKDSYESLCQRITKWTLLKWNCNLYFPAW